MQLGKACIGVEIWGSIGSLWIDWGNTLLISWINLFFGALFWFTQAHSLFTLFNVMSCEVQMI